MAGRLHDRAAQHVAASALQHRHDAGALSGLKHEGVAIRNAQGVPKAWISKRVGGDQIDYVDERPEVRRIFAAELAKHGVAPRMDGAYAKELTDLGLKTA